MMNHSLNHLHSFVEAEYTLNTESLHEVGVVKINSKGVTETKLMFTRISNG